MNIDEMNDILEQVEVRDGTERNWKFYVYRNKLEGGGFLYFLQAMFQRPDRDTGVIGPGFGRPVPIDETITDVGLTQAALGSMLDILEHEAREGFFYKGDRVFDPHRKAFVHQ